LPSEPTTVTAGSIIAPAGVSIAGRLTPPIALFLNLFGSIDGCAAFLNAVVLIAGGRAAGMFLTGGARLGIAAAFATTGFFALFIAFKSALSKVAISDS
jgi:hypothetical protein